jgi:hypothetical protein
MLSNTERGKAFQLLCRDALNRTLGRTFDLEVPIDIGGTKPHLFDLATRERDIVAECKAFAFTATGKNSVSQNNNAPGGCYVSPHDSEKLRKAPHRETQRTPIRLETLGRQFVRLNKHHLEQVVVLEMAESGGELVCLRGSLDALKHVTDFNAKP